MLAPTCGLRPSWASKPSPTCRVLRGPSSHRRFVLCVKAFVGSSPRKSQDSNKLGKPGRTLLPAETRSTVASPKNEAMLDEVSLCRLASEADKSKAAASLNGPPSKTHPPKTAPKPKQATTKLKPTEVQWPPKRPFVAIAWDNAMDSVAETHRHLKRLAAPLPQTDPVKRLVSEGKDKPLKLAPTKKPVVLVLGSGWGSHRLSKIIDHETFDVVVVSPRNHFVFTPMLPLAAIGGVEARSLLEPVRVSNPFVTYLQATCDSIDLHSKTATCSSTVALPGGHNPKFQVQYDKLVVAIGEQPTSFGVPGVWEHCYFIKEINDSLALRARIGSLFEMCSLPSTSESERERSLHFTVVGGGPCGVEFAGTLADYLKTDLKKKYPQLMKYVKVTLLQSAQMILAPFQKHLQQMALENLRGHGVDVRLGVRVVAVTDKQVKLQSGEVIQTATVVWSTGNSARQLVKDLVAAIPEQAQYQRGPAPVTNKLAVDPFLRVIGARDVFAIGDNSAVVGSDLPPTGQVAAQEGSYLAHLLNAGYSAGLGGMFEAPPSRPKPTPLLPPLPPGLEPLKSFLMGGKTREEVGGAIAKQLAALEEPPWAAAARARNAGSELLAPKSWAARLSNQLLHSDGKGHASGEPAQKGSVEFQTRAFEFLDFGLMAYVGDDKALTQLEAFDLRMALHGQLAYLLWRSIYLAKQVSMRNRMLIVSDWIKVKLFGRDLNLLA